MGWILPAIIAAQGTASWLGQRSANKGQAVQDTEAARQAQQKHAYNKARYDAEIQRKQNTTNFIKAIAAQRGLKLPDEVWGLLSQSPGQFPQYSAPTPGYKPSALLTGVTGAAGAAAKGLGSKYAADNNLNLSDPNYALGDAMGPFGKPRG